MEKIRASYIIHGMALLHVGATLACQYIGISDSLLLTLLTMTMTVLICLKKEMSAEFAAIAIVLVNILGYFVGTYGGRIMGRWAATFVTTELLGWGVLLFIRLFPKRAPSKMSWTENSGWMIAAVTIVFMLRVALDLLLSSSVPDSDMIIGVIEVSAFCLLFVLYFAARMSNQTELEKEKTHQAEFRYMALKQQINPHFLFNSLNVLDSLVWEGGREETSQYVHKLSGMYRYMLQHEGEKLVRLSEEEDFARMYVDLMKVRFPKGLEVNIDIPDEALPARAVPCTIQLLIENAIKHNAFSEENPLVIDVTADMQAGTLKVENNCHPRLSPSNSTGLGLSYIRRQYADHTTTYVEVIKTEDNFKVILPLL